jgi:RNA 3'-terminal phosphate cyclase
MKDISRKVLKFSGHGYLRQRLILATLSGKIVKIDKIRSEDEDPGLKGKYCNFFFRGTRVYFICNLSRRFRKKY